MRVGKAFKVTVSLTAFFFGFFVGVIAFLGALMILASADGFVVWRGDLRVIVVLIVSGMWLAFLVMLFRTYLRDNWPR